MASAKSSGATGSKTKTSRREKGERDCQGGNQCSGRELLRRNKGREWGTMVRPNDAKKMEKDGRLKPTPVTKPKPDYATVKLLAAFLEAIKAQLAGRTAGRQLPKGMEVAVSVLGSISQLFLPPSAHAALTAKEAKKEVKMEKDNPPPNGYKELVEKLPDRPARKLLVAAVKGKYLPTLANLVDIIFTYGIMLEVTDRAVKGLLEILSKKKPPVLEEEDVEEYQIYITTLLKEAELNKPLSFVPQLVDCVEVVKGEVRLKRKRLASPLLPPRPNWHSLRSLGLIANTVHGILIEQQKEAEKESKAMTPLDRLLLRSLCSMNHVFLRGWSPECLAAPSPEVLVHLCIQAKYLCNDPDTHLAAIGAKLQHKISENEMTMERVELAGMLYYLARRLFFPASVYKLLLGNLVAAKLLTDEDVTELVARQKQEDRVNGVNILGVLTELSQRMEVNGEEVWMRRVAVKDATIAEPLPLAPYRSPLPYAWDPTLDLLYEYALRARFPHLVVSSAKTSYQADLYEKALRRLEILPTGGKEPGMTYLRESKDGRKECSKAKLSTLIGIMGAGFKMDKSGVLPFLFFLKAQGLLTPAQFDTIYHKSPYPVSPPILRLILDKVYAWNVQPAQIIRGAQSPAAKI